MVALWQKLAERYKDEPAIAAYDIINEPNWGFADRNDKHGCNETGNAPLRTLLERTTRAIREIDKRHMIVIEGNCWGNNYRGVLDAGLWDDNLVLSFHKYWNGTTRETIADQLALAREVEAPACGSARRARTRTTGSRARCRRLRPKASVGPHGR